MLPAQVVIVGISDNANRLIQAIMTTIPPAGSTFNESSTFPDEVTLRPTRRLTMQRDRNQMPTYHLHNGFSADGRFFLSLDEASELAVWNTSTWETVAELKVPAKGTLGVAPDGRHVAVAGRRGVIYILRLPDLAK